MPNVAKVLVSNQTYDIKDSVARNNNSLVQTEIGQVEEKLQGEINALGERVAKNTQDIEHFAHSGVSTVNGKDGDVVLKAADVQAAPIEHIEEEASSDIFGHVIITDNYKTETAPAGAPIAASAKALQEAYAEIKDNMLEKRHDSTTTDYGIGSSSRYGHVKINHTFDTINPEKNDGIAASSYAVQQAYNDLSQKIEDAIPSPGVMSVNGHTGYQTISHPGESGGNITLTIDELGGAPENHSVPITNSPKYGLGDQENFGHVSLSDKYNVGDEALLIENSGANTGQGASLYAVQKAYQDLRLRLDESENTKSGIAKEVGFNNTQSNLTLIDSITGEPKEVKNVQDAIDAVVQQGAVVEANPVETGKEQELQRIKIGFSQYKLTTPTEIYIGTIAPADEQMKLFIDLSENYGVIEYANIEDSQEAF